MNSIAQQETQNQVVFITPQAAADAIRASQVEGLTPRQMGQVDRLEGYGCVPEMYYLQEWMCEEYRQGWRYSSPEMI